MRYALLFALATITSVALLAALARRLLGVQVSLRRALVAGGMGLVGESMFGLALPQDLPRGTLAGLQAGIAFVTAVAFLVVSEMVVPGGVVGWPNRWWGALRQWGARTHRYQEILSIAAKHHLGGYLVGRRRRRRPGESPRVLAASLRSAMEEGGLTFVKLGQLLATRVGEVPPDVVAELSHLHSDVAAAPWDQVREELDAQLGRPVEEVFATVDPRPMAAAAVAQVHAARLADGTPVVVKVRRRGIRAELERDLDILGRLARTLHRRTRWGGNLGIRELAAGFSVSLREELDFRVEARNTLTVAAVVPPGSPVRTPVVHREWTRPGVLVLDRFEGEALSLRPARLAALPAEERHRLAVHLLHCVLYQVMIGGCFHADPHPGNVLLLEDGGIALLDYGSVGRLDAVVRGRLRTLLIAADNGDRTALSHALLDLVMRVEDLDEEQFEREIGRFLATHLAAGAASPAAEMMADLLLLANRFGLAVLPDVAAVFRCLITLEGTLTLLSPGFDFFAEARQDAARMMREQLTVRSVRDALVKDAAMLLPIVRGLPRRLDQIVRTVERGDLTVQVRLLADTQERSVLSGMLNQVLTAFLGGVTGLMAVLLMTSSAGPRITGELSLYQLIGYHLLMLSSVLTIRVLSVMLRR